MGGANEASIPSMGVIIKMGVNYLDLCMIIRKISFLNW